MSKPNYAEVTLKYAYKDEPFINEGSIVFNPASKSLTIWDQETRKAITIDGDSFEDFLVQILECKRLSEEVA